MLKGYFGLVTSSCYLDGSNDGRYQCEIDKKMRNFEFSSQARRKHFGSGAAIGTKKQLGVREFGHFKALKLALLQQFRQDFYYKNLKAERHILKD